MKCSRCDVQMVDGLVGKERPLHLRFVPKDRKFFVWDYAGVVAYACPKCGGIQLAVDPEVLKATVKKG
jgi:hypothetical protein